MAKAVHDDVLDAALDKVATSTRLTVCDNQPTTVADLATMGLADVTLTPGDGLGDFTVANGDTSGRKVTVEEQAGIPVDTTGTATHVALDDGVFVLYVTTCTAQVLTALNTVTVPAWDIEIADPT